MNLLIGLISERLSEILEGQVRNDYYELCHIVYDIESLIIGKNGFRCCGRIPDEEEFRTHFVYAESKVEPNIWDGGRVKATVAPI